MRSAPIGFEPLSFYLNLVGYPVGRSPAARAMHLSCLLGVAQVANATGFLYQSLNRFREAVGVEG
jgi:hypothetical protein